MTNQTNSFKTTVRNWNEETSAGEIVRKFEISVTPDEAIIDDWGEVHYVTTEAEGWYGGNDSDLQRIVDDYRPDLERVCQNKVNKLTAKWVFA